MAQIVRWTLTYPALKREAKAWLRRYGLPGNWKMLPQKKAETVRRLREAQQVMSVAERHTTRRS